MKKYWRAGKDSNEIRANEGHDGHGRPPVVALKKEWKHGQIWIWKAQNEDPEPDEVIKW